MIRENCGAVLALFVAFSLSACGASQSQQRRKEGVAELRKIQTAVHGISILVSAGISQQEYSRRLGDVLLEIGDLDQSIKQTLPKIPQEEQLNVKAAYAHLSKSIEAYQAAKDFFGDTHKTDLDPFEGGHNLFDEQTYRNLRSRFPRLGDTELAVDYKGVAGLGKLYWKGEMLQALWLVAAEEEAAAKTLIEAMEQQR